MTEALSNEESPESIPNSIGEVCPSCGAISTLEARTAAGESMRCPICGTEMLLGEAEHSPAADAREASAQATVPAPQTEQSSRAPSAEKLLLDRLIATPAIPEQAPMITVIVLLLAILGIGIGIHFTTQPAESFLKQTGAADDPQGNGQDSVLLFQKRTAAQPVIDSLKRSLNITPEDPKALLELADAYFDAEYWQDSKQTFEAYLKINPKDVDARVDYASTLDRSDNNVQAAINQIEKALEFDPQHVRGLFNAGILSLRGMDQANHKASLDQAKSYLERARKAAEIRDTSAIPSIDRILSQFEKMAPAKTE